MEKTILIVEDDTNSLRLTRDLLQVSGYFTLEAYDGKQAVDLAKTKKPDLILMDIQLPVIDGLEATRMIKADMTIKDIPVIAVTANAMRGDEAKVLQAGCDGYITKPINIHTLLEKVSRYLSVNNVNQTVQKRSWENEKH